MTTRFPFLVYLVAEILTSGCPRSNSSSVRSVASSAWSFCSVVVTPNSSTRLGVATEAALEAYVGGFDCVGPLPWALAVPDGTMGFDGGKAFTSLALGWRPATVTDSAEMVLFKLESSACSKLSCRGAVGVFWGGKPKTSWKMGCM